jgi:hypothetical protein
MNLLSSQRVNASAHQIQMSTLSLDSFSFLQK